ncbi:hypothetical protein E2P81_ATG03185 [Venturia nashicola]|nr:hypothetical protein E2P81_ATG03185 [Venturia nashicola]
MSPAKLHDARKRHISIWAFWNVSVGLGEEIVWRKGEMISIVILGIFLECQTLGRAEKRLGGCRVGTDGVAEWGQTEHRLLQLGDGTPLEKDLTRTRTGELDVAVWQCGSVAGVIIQPIPKVSVQCPVSGPVPVSSASVQSSAQCPVPVSSVHRHSIGSTYESRLGTADLYSVLNSQYSRLCTQFSELTSQDSLLRTHFSGLTSQDSLLRTHFSGLTPQDSVLNTIALLHLRSPWALVELSTLGSLIRLSTTGHCLFSGSHLRRLRFLQLQHSISISISNPRQQPAPATRTSNPPRLSIYLGSGVLAGRHISFQPQSGLDARFLFPGDLRE